jgi:arginine deiminase
MVTSDIDILRKVIVHRPDQGIEWVTPFNKAELLYDDIVFLPKMQEEHSLLTGVLSFFAGEENVLEFTDLLTDILTDAKLRSQLLDEVFKLESLPPDTQLVMQQLSPENLAKALISGYKAGGNVLLNPVPNLIFTRDIGAVVNNYVITCQAEKMPRKRENILTWFITHHHPVFVKVGYKYLDLCTSSDHLATTLSNRAETIEGGDIIHLSPSHLLIGCSERTNMVALWRIREQLREHKVVEKFTIVDIPKEEYCMHIDTIFSKVNDHDYVLYEHVLQDPTQISIESFDLQGNTSQRFDTIKDLILAEDAEARFVSCGNGEHPFDQREQWSSACNFVAVKPGVTITYRRNTKTIEGFQQLGYKVTPAEEFLQQAAEGKIDKDQIQNTIITIPAGELSRGSGGPHCLTFPIERG